MNDQNHGFIRVTNWTRFQHYKTRKPPWVKFYTELLHPQNKLNALPVPTRFLFDRLLLLAAEWDNAIPNDSELIANLLRMDQRDVSEGLADLAKGKWISQTKTNRRASKTLANLQDPETEAEAETETPLPPFEETRNNEATNAALRWLNGHGWDSTYDRQAILEEAGRVARRGVLGYTVGLNEAAVVAEWERLHSERFEPSDEEAA